MELADLLRELVELDGSDLYLAVGAVPSINKDGRLMRLNAAKDTRLDPENAERFAKTVMSEERWNEFARVREANLAHMEGDAGRFRVNVFWQRGTVAMVFRRVKMEIPTLKDLGLPKVLRDIALGDRGIVLVTGATGAGKSTSMASMLDYRNHNRSGHIVTIEDPVEFLYRHRRSIVTQREVGIDTETFHDALKNTLRQAPQVIAIGELRDAETVQFALHASETGHLVFATLHSTNATITLERILNFYPGELMQQVLNHLAENIKAVISQRLVPRVDAGRVAAAEVLVNTPTVQALIRKAALGDIRQLLGSENQDGQQSMDKSLFKLIKRGIISVNEGLGAAESANDLQLKLRGIGIEPGSSWEDHGDEWINVQDPYALPGSQTSSRFAAEQREPMVGEGSFQGMTGNRKSSGTPGTSFSPPSNPQVARPKPQPMTPRPSLAPEPEAAPRPAPVPLQSVPPTPSHVPPPPMPVPPSGGQTPTMTPTGMPRPTIPVVRPNAPGIGGPAPLQPRPLNPQPGGSQQPAPGGIRRPKIPDLPAGSIDDEIDG